jgi:hypothetical protein
MVKLLSGMPRPAIDPSGADALTLAVDAERMLLRSAEMLQPPAVRIAIEADGMPDETYAPIS